MTVTCTRSPMPAAAKLASPERSRSPSWRAGAPWASLYRRASRRVSLKLVMLRRRSLSATSLVKTQSSFISDRSLASDGLGVLAPRAHATKAAVPGFPFRGNGGNDRC
jgi:hypothetical protein